MMSTYRRYLTNTAKYDHPPRYGYDWFCCAIDWQWEQKGSKMEWDSMEQCLRDILGSPRLIDAEKVKLCKEAIAAFTRRGEVEETK